MSRPAIPKQPSALTGTFYAPASARVRITKSVTLTDITVAALEDLRHRSGRISFSHLCAILIERQLQAMGIDPAAYAPAGAGSLPLPASAIASGKVPDPQPHMLPATLPDPDGTHARMYGNPDLATGRYPGFICIEMNWGGHVIAYGPDLFRWLNTVIQPGDLHPTRLPDSGENPAKIVPYDNRTGQLQRMVWFLDQAGYRRIRNLLWHQKRQMLLIDTPASDHPEHPDKPLAADETALATTSASADTAEIENMAGQLLPADRVEVAGDPDEEEMLPNDTRVIDELMKVGKRG